ERLAWDHAPRVSGLRYPLSLTIPAERTTRIAGRETLSFMLADAARPLALDFEPNGAGGVHAMEVNGQRVTPTLRDGHIVLADRLREGENRVVIDFDAGDAPLNRNDEYLYTIFVPARAHEA